MLPGQQWSGGEPVGSLLEGDRVLMNLWSYKFWVESARFSEDEMIDTSIKFLETESFRCPINHSKSFSNPEPRLTRSARLGPPTPPSLLSP